MLRLRPAAPLPSSPPSPVNYITVWTAEAAAHYTDPTLSPCLTHHSLTPTPPPCLAWSWWWSERRVLLLLVVVVVSWLSGLSVAAVTVTAAQQLRRPAAAHSLPLQWLLQLQYC